MTAAVNDTSRIAARLMMRVKHAESECRFGDAEDMRDAADALRSAEMMCDSYAAENQRFSDEIERLKNAFTIRASTPALTDDERKTVGVWRPTVDNQICKCVADHVCEYHALVAIIDRLSSSPAKAGVPSGVAARKHAERLKHSAITATNDDLSDPRTEKRMRHVSRYEAMLDAAAFLEELADHWSAGTRSSPVNGPTPDEQRRADIETLLSQLEELVEATGEDLDIEDQAIRAQIKQSISSG